MTGRSLNAPVRVLKNAMTTEYLKIEREGIEREEMERLTLGSLRKAVVEGDVKNGSLMMGQVAAMCKEVKPFSQIIDTLLAEAAEDKKAFEKKSQELIYGKEC